MGEEFNEKIRNFINKLDDALTMKKLPFKFIIDDPAGNSFIENPFAPNSDPYAKILFYDRSKELLEKMGYSQQPDDEKDKRKNKLNEKKKIYETLNKNTDTSDKKTEGIPSNEFISPKYYDNRQQFQVYKSSSEISSHLIDFTKSVEDNSSIKEEALKFPANCLCCHAEGESYMCICTIPFFKEIIISCFKCQECGYKSSDVKGGGGMSDKGTKFTLHIKSPADLNRDLFKSETASITIPEIDFETDTGSMGGMFTTVEGVLEKIIGNISDLPFSQGDSNESNLLDIFCTKMKNLVEKGKDFTLIINDPLSNSFIFSPDPNNDPNLIKEEYERSWEQNEELGINDMITENYAVEEGDEHKSS